MDKNKNQGLQMSIEVFGKKKADFIRRFLSVDVVYRGKDAIIQLIYHGEHHDLTALMGFSRVLTVKASMRGLIYKVNYKELQVCTISLMNFINLYQDNNGIYDINFDGTSITCSFDTSGNTVQRKDIRK